MNTTARRRVLLVASLVVAVCATVTVSSPRPARADASTADASATDTPPDVGAAVVGGQGSDRVEVVYYLRETSNGYLQCSGILLEPRWVLTAAHCVTSGLGGNSVTIFGFRTDFQYIWEMPGTAFVHPSFDPDSLRYDFALVLLNEAPLQTAPFGVANIADPIEDYWAFDGAYQHTITGFGQYIEGDPSTTGFLLEADLTLQPSQPCVEFLAGLTGDPKQLEFDASSLLCTVDFGTSGCFGDSGGPLYAQRGADRRLLGTMSFILTGFGCDVINFFGSVPAVKSWILSMIASSGGRSVSRYAGANRYATAATAASAWRQEEGEGTVVYLSTGEKFPDALGGGPAASVEGAPILLVTATGVPSDTAQELRRLRPKKIVVLGGTAAVADDVVNQVLAITGPQTQIVRRAGANRYATSVLVSQGAFSDAVNRVWIASGESFLDGLIAGAAGAYFGEPVLLVQKDSAPAEVLAELQRLTVTSIHVVGDANTIGAGARSALATIAPLTEYASTDVYERSVAVWGNLPSTGALTLATSADWPDGLAGGPLSSKTRAPLLLVAPTCLPGPVSAKIAAWAPQQLWLLGGPKALSESIVSLPTC